jgi:hypothetical protein
MLHEGMDVSMQAAGCRSVTKSLGGRGEEGNKLKHAVQENTCLSRCSITETCRLSQRLVKLASWQNPSQLQHRQARYHRENNLW